MLSEGTTNKKELNS